LQDPSEPSSIREANLVVRLLTEALDALDVDGVEARRHILRARALILQGINTPHPIASGGLAGWQMRRVEAFVHRNLAGRLRIDQVAQELKVSPGYLSRAFKATAGITYSEFVLRTRIALAKRLLLTTATPISEIALTCGLTDQSHLTRIFKRAVGVPPAAWRRQFERGAEPDHVLIDMALEGAGLGARSAVPGHSELDTPSSPQRRPQVSSASERAMTKGAA